MPDIHIHRDHKLGLAQARKIALIWAEDAETRFAMTCKIVEGEAGDTVAFTRTGVKGELSVAADHFDVVVQLGFLLGAFSKAIEAEIVKNLDAQLSKSSAAAAAAPAQARPAAKKPARTSAKKSARK